MSWKRKYKCNRCSYSVDIYENKGFFGQRIKPMYCPDCKTIQNIVVGGVIGDVAPSFNSESGRLCLQCGSDRIVPWDGHTCPKCGAEMLPDGEKEFWM